MLRFPLAHTSVAFAACTALAVAACGQCSSEWLRIPEQGLLGVGGGIALTSITWDPDGDGPLPDMLVVGGSFNYAGDIAANRIAAWDGNRWLTFGSGMD